MVASTALLLCGPPSANAQRPKPLAKVGTQEIMPIEIKTLLGIQTDDVRQRLLANPKQFEEFIKAEAERKALLMEARRAGIDKRLDVALLMQRAQEQALLTAYLGPRLAIPQNYPGEEEIARYYENNKDRFFIPEQVNVSTIFLLVLPAWTRDRSLQDKVLAEAQRIAAQGRKGDDFGELARLHSQDRPTADNGGVVGWVTAAQLLPELTEAAFKLKPGEVSDPIRAQLGYHVLRVNDRKPGVQQTLAEARRSIVQLLQTEYRMKKEREAIDVAVKANPVSPDSAAIEKWRADEVAATAQK